MSLYQFLQTHRNRRHILWAIFVLALALFCETRVYAQVTSSIVGTITDQTGATVPDVQVTLTNAATGFVRIASTNSSGNYVASAIPTGSYTIVAKRQGFKALQHSAVELTAASTLTVDLQLTVGEEVQTVSVTGAAPLLQAQSADVSALVDDQQMVALPLATRDFTDLVLLTPGAHLGSASNLQEGLNPYAMRGGTNYSVNGSVAAANTYFIDGITDRALWTNTLVMVPVVDAIQEYRVLTSNYSAEYGAAAGAVTEVETKSGGNSLHGTAWEFLRNNDLNANDYFNNQKGIARPSYHRNEFGATAGGPIRKNKAFFFGDYQGIHASYPITTTSTIPSLAQDQMVESGNFANLGVTIYNPYSTSVVNGATVRNPFPNNQITPNLLDPAIGKLMTLMPAPQTSAAVNNYTYNGNTTQSTNQFDVRIDQNLGAADHIFVRYGYDKSRFTSPGVIPSPANSTIPIGPYLSTNTNGNSEPLFNQSATVGYTKLIGQNKIIESHVGMIRWHAQITPLGSPFNTAQALGIANINLNARSGGMPAFTVTGFQEIGDNSTYPEDSAITSYQVDGAFTLVHGNHTFKMGIMALRHYFNGFSAFPTRGTFDFNGQFTRQITSSSSATALADLAMGAEDSASRNILNGEFGMRFWDLAPFVQDTWRATNRLTVDFGFRWEIDAPPYDAHNHWANLNIKTGQLIVAGLNGASRRLRNFDLDTAAPRLGLAYALGADRKTVIRAGAGISYVQTDAAGSQLYKNLPFYFAQTVTTSTNAAPVSTVTQGFPLPVQPDPNNTAAISTGSPTAWDWNLKQTQMVSWSVGVQRQLASTLMLDISYVGTKGNRLLVNPNINQAVPGSTSVASRRPFNSINPNLVKVVYRSGLGQSKYESLQAHLEKRFSRGLTFGVSYTYGEYMSDAGNPNGSGNSDWQNDYCLACNWGPTPDAYRHILSVNHVYNLPFGQNEKFANRGPLAYVVGGWTLNGIWSFHSGGTFTPIWSTNVSNQNGGGDQRPNRIANGALSGNQRTISHWFDTTAFVAPAQYTYGNSGTGILYGPRYFDTDLGLGRKFQITERYALTFRSEWFNSFNRANFTNPNATVGTASAGVISSDVAPRVIQMALKLVF